MRPPKHHNIQFHRTSGKDVAAWDNFRAPRTLCDITNLRMYATRLRISSPRGMCESVPEYVERVAETLIQRNKSHLSLKKTEAAIDNWFYGGVRG
jgi:hypothetical protein